MVSTACSAYRNMEKKLPELEEREKDRATTLRAIWTCDMKSIIKDKHKPNYELTFSLGND